MKKLFILISSMALIAILFVQKSDAQITKTVGTTGSDFATLNLAFTAINNNAGGIYTGAITLQIKDNTTETATAALNASSNWTSVTIYPTVSGKTISGNIVGPLIDLNGADNVTIDGRVNETGSTNLVITNINTGTGNTTSTIRFINSADNNTVKYCTLKGAETSTASGLIFFSTATAGNGNSGNTIDNNNITRDAAGRPVNAIFSQGSTGFENSGNTISNNNIYDFLNNGTVGVTSHGIYIFSNNTTWTISGNNLYETTSFIPVADIEYDVILINSSGNNYNISNNNIGGSSAGCGGSAWTKTNAKNNTFYALYLNVGVTSASSIQNNTIKNFVWNNSAAADWIAINIQAGAMNIGTTTGNTIGSASGTGSIVIGNGGNGANVYGIKTAGTTDCQNNTIGSFTVTNTDGTFANNFYGISRTSGGNTNIYNNIIGSSSTANSIQINSTSTSNTQNVIGIINTGGGSLTINSNIIANLHNGSTNNATGVVDGIESSGTNTITNNTIHDLTNANANPASDNTASVCGIALTDVGSIKTVTGNTIYNLSNTYTSFAGSVIGLYFTGSTGANTVSRNFIHNLSVNASSTLANLYGIKINAGVVTYSNNIISLGGNSATTIYGIYDPGTVLQTCNLYFNSIYIGGSLSSGLTNKSYCLYSNSSANTRNIRNNIFENARSTTSGSSLHYAAYFNYAVSTLLTLDFNDYFASGTGGVLGYYNSLDVSSLPLITGFDANSMAINPSFSNAGGTIAANYIPTVFTLAGTYINGFSTDYASVNRAGTPTMGAYEVTLNLNVDVYIANIFQSGYTTLKGAFDKINSGLHTGAIEIRVKANTIETASAVLNASGSGSASYTSINIYPTITGITIAGNMDAYLIDFYGADNVTIDGRVNATGSTKDMTITNASTGSAQASTIRFYASAENNTVKYCTIKGSGTNTGRGIIFFSSASSGNGNDGNTIDNNNITSDAAGRPINAIYSAGLSGYENNFNTISNNNIYNFLRVNSSSWGINVATMSSDWTISGNSLYETTTFVPTMGGNTYIPIRVASVSKNLVSGNYIGGSAPLCGSSAWTIGASFPNTFYSIYISGGATIATAATVQNNIIRNINYTSTQSNPWDGIYINSGNVDVTGNTIGATTGTGSITVSTPAASATTTMSGGAVTAITMNSGGSGYTIAPVITFSTSGSTTTATADATVSAGVVTVHLLTGGAGYTSAPSVYFDGVGTNYSTIHPINNVSPGTVNISGNNIGSITTVGSAYYSSGIESIYLNSSTGAHTISNNLVGSLSTANSIHASTNAVSSVTKQDVYGIYSASTGTTIISGNTIANLTNEYTGTNTGTRTRGIVTTGGSNTVRNNTVRNISTSSAQSGTASNASLVGISQIATTAGITQTVTGNTIYDLSNTNAINARVDIYGVYYAGPTTGIHEVSGNFIHSLSISSSTNTASCINGIAMNSGAVVTCANNIINLGVGNTLGYQINGIWDGTVLGNTVNFYFNTVYIGGSVSSGVTSATAALNNANNTSIRNYRNNIFDNARTGGTTGKHYAIVLAGTVNTTIDYNDYFFAGTVLGKIGTLEKATLAAWKLGTIQDTNSLSTNPNFSNAGGTTPLNYYPSATLLGVSGTGIVTDFSGFTRGTPPKMGALEANIWIGATSTDFATASNWFGGVVPVSGTDIAFSATPSNNCVLDINRTIGNITNAQATYKLVVNGHQLTITGNLYFTNSAQIDATAASSVVVFGGATAQTIDSSRYLNDIINNLTIDNSSGVTLNTNFTISNNLVINSGKLFAVAAGKALTVTGTITNSGGASGFILKSDTTGTASLLHNTNAVPATVQRYISGAVENWHFLSSPVADQDITENQGTSNSWLPSGSYSNGTGYDLYLWNEPNSSWITKLNPIWNTLNPGTNFVVGRGYIYSVEAANPTKKFVGTLNNGTINYALTAGSSLCCLNGFNLVGNPYPSSVDWSAASGWARADLVSSGGGKDMWIWNASANNYGVFNSADADGVGTNLVSRYIAPMQAYFVRTATSSTLGMDNTLRVHSSASWFKESQQDVTKLSLSVISDAGYGFDEIRLNFGSSENEKGALKLFSEVHTAPSLYMRFHSDTLSVRYFTSTQENPVVPVSYSTGKNGNYTIHCNFDQSKFETVLLEDRQTQYIQNMKTTNTYNFNASTMDDANRFVLYFKPDYFPANGKLPAKIYTDGNQLIVDLTLIDKKTEVSVFDVLGQLLVQKNLEGETKNNINVIATAQILFVYLKNTDGTLCKKLFYYSNK